MKTLEMSFDNATKIKTQLEENVKILSESMSVFPRGSMGLISDEVKKTDEYISVKSAYDIGFKELQNFNKVYVKQFKKELQKMRKEKYK